MFNTAYRPIAAACGLAALMAFAAHPATAATEDDLAKIKLPPGFSISIYAQVPNARAIAALPDSHTVIATTRKHIVWAILDTDRDYRADEVFPLAEPLKAPTGVAWRDGYIYVAEQHRVRRAKFDEARPLRLLIWKLVRGGLFDNRHHGSRDLAFGHDGRLYLSLGVPCNICMPESPLDSILSMDPDGGNEMIYATGIRNSVGMDFHPVTGELFFTDNGADSMGDESPPDELNRAHRAGLFFGFPYFGGGRDRTPQFRGQIPPREVTFPALELQPHAAALGLHFYRGDMFPAEYKHDAFIAQHGSWNRTEPVGYRLMRVRFNDQGRPTGQEVFAEGWLQPGGPWGRPNDVAEFPDGSLLVSDDVAGVIYRITYAGN